MAQGKRGRAGRRRRNGVLGWIDATSNVAWDATCALAGMGGYVADGVRAAGHPTKGVRAAGRMVRDAAERLRDRGRQVLGPRERVTVIDLTDLESMTVQELRDLAKTRELEGRSHMTKEELVSSLASGGA